MYYNPLSHQLNYPNTSLSTVLDISDTSYTMSGNKTLMPNDNFYSTKTFLIANADNQATNFATQVILQNDYYIRSNHQYTFTCIR
nr:MAG: hypothetical protein CM15mV30_1570 [uncultured marine virus]